METKRKAGWIALGWILSLGSSHVHAQGTATETIDSELNVEPFFLVTTSQEGGEVNLGPILPGEGSFQAEVKVDVLTNTGRPYQVVQKMTGPPVNERGLEFPSSRLQLAVSDGIRGGQSQVKGFQPLAPGITVLFSSTPKGAADQFTITYRSSTEGITPTGSYRTSVGIEGEML